MVKLSSKKIIEVSDWDALVSETYGKPYSFQQQDGCKDRGLEPITVPVEYPEDVDDDGNEWGVSFKTWLERDPKEPIPDQKYDWELRMFWEREFYPHVDMIINDLHSKGLLKAGKYSINIDW